MLQLIGVTSDKAGAAIIADWSPAPTPLPASPSLPSSSHRRASAHLMPNSRRFPNLVLDFPGKDSCSIYPSVPAPSPSVCINYGINDKEPDPRMVSLNRRRYRPVCDPAQAGTCAPVLFFAVMHWAMVAASALRSSVSFCLRWVYM
ncbi:hypothetical protein BJX76DRAFT_282044 [Aspergillus varians]